MNAAAQKAAAFVVDAHPAAVLLEAPAPAAVPRRPSAGDVAAVGALDGRTHRPPSAQELGDLVLGPRVREEEALRVGAAELPQERDLPIGLHALHDGAEPEIAR